jgi:transcriptional antiterminator NusG
MKWYIVRTQSNRERSVSEKLIKESSEDGMLFGKIGKVVVPVERKVSARNGKKIFREKVMYPGYVFVEVSVIGELTNYLKNCDGASCLLSSKGGELQSISDSEVERMIGIIQNIDETAELSFVVGQEIVITDGPFSSFNGIIEYINDQRVKISVMIFGRKTPLELSINQIDRINA